MLQTNKLKQALRGGEPVYGLLNSVPAPLLVEMLGYAGYDFVVLDLEHVNANPETLENMIRAAECAGLTALVAVMIEDRAGVENIDAIVAVPGVDLVMEGAIDLSQSYGVPGQTQHPEVQAAIRQIADACRRHGVPFCAVPRLPEQGEYWRRRGVEAFLLGDDRGVAFRAFKAHRQSWECPQSP